jgi:PqqD family protein of HPr-rel-A system
MSVFNSLTISQDGFAFNSVTGESFTLNSCSQMILNHLQDGATSQEIIKFLSREFSITYNQAERDVADFFEQLHRLGFTGVNP